MSITYKFSIQNDFPNHLVSLDRLTLEIQLSTIQIALDYISTFGDECDIVFKASLSSGDQTTLNGLVATHSGVALTTSQNVTIKTQTTNTVNAYANTVGSAFTALRATTFAEMNTPLTRSIASSNAVDFLSGTGAQKVMITFYDDTLQGPYTETVCLSGTTPVKTIAGNICYVDNLTVVQVGSQLGNVGNISLFSGSAGNGTIMSQIAASDNQTFYAHHYVGPGKIAKLSSINGFINGTNGGTITLRTVNPTSINKPEITVGAPVHLAPGVNASYVPVIPTPVAGPSRILLYGKADGTPGNMGWTVSFSYYEDSST